MVCSKLYLSFLHYHTLSRHWTAERPSINATFPVLKKGRISRTLHPLSEERKRFEQQGAAPRKIFHSRSYLLSLSYSLCYSFSPLIQLPHVPVAVCLTYLENPFRFCRLQCSTLAKGGLFPWTLPLKSGSLLTDNVSRDSVAVTVGFSVQRVLLPIHLTHVASEVAQGHFKSTDFQPWQKC